MSNIRKNKRIIESIRINIVAFSLLSLTVIMGYSVSPYRFDGDKTAILEEKIAQLALEVEHLQGILLEEELIK